VRIHHLSGKLKERFGWSLNWTESRTATLVDVNTDEGITGWGDGSYGGSRLLAHPELVIGRSPFEVEAIFDDMLAPAFAQFDRGEPTSAGLDVALWDIAGRALGKPVSALLGSRTAERVHPYCTCMYRRDWSGLAAGLAEEACEWAARGHRILKMKIGFGPELDIEIVRAVRRAIGPENGLAVDANCGYDDGTAFALGHELERLRLLWWEAPDLDTVGLTGGRRLAYMCSLNGVRLIPHNWGTHVRTAFALHWTSSFPQLGSWLAMFEFDRAESPFREAVVRQKIEMDPSDGTIAGPTSQGLGVHVIALESGTIEAACFGRFCFC